MKKLIKCKNKMLCGVCCGLANSLDLDISIIRIGFVLGAFFTGSILFWVYLLMALVMPKEE